jgi:hypothetical protein
LVRLRAKLIAAPQLRLAESKASLAVGESF